MLKNTCFEGDCIISIFPAHLWADCNAFRSMLVLKAEEGVMIYLDGCRVGMQWYVLVRLPPHLLHPAHASLRVDMPSTLCRTQQHVGSIRKALVFR